MHLGLDLRGCMLRRLCLPHGCYVCDLRS
jgi:hypothetical protein